MKKPVIVLTPLSLTFCLLVWAQERNHETSDFLKPTVDLRCVVSDGFKVAGGFVVEPEFATQTGLTDKKKLEVKILTLGDGATKLKLMQAEGKSAKPKNDHINTTLGFSYITVFIGNTHDAVARLASAPSRRPST